MKVAVLIARILLGLIFVFFGLNGLLHFLPSPPIPGVAGQFVGALFVSHYVLAVSALQVIGGLLMLIGRYIPLGLVILGPIIVNILLFHLTMAPSSIGPGLLATVLWFIVFFGVRSAFAGIFVAKVEPTV
jgi:putative oxidoreductase